MAKEKVSFKTPSIIDGAKTVYENLKNSRKAVENMPECSIKKSLMLSQETYEKKINSIVKKEIISKALAAIRKNPELINSLPDDVKASFARNEEETVSENPDISGVSNVKKPGKKTK